MIWNTVFFEIKNFLVLDSGAWLTGIHSTNFWHFERFVQVGLHSRRKMSKQKGIFNDKTNQIQVTHDQYLVVLPDFDATKLVPPKQKIPKRKLVQNQFGRSEIWKKPRPMCAGAHPYGEVGGLSHRKIRSFYPSVQFEVENTKMLYDVVTCCVFSGLLMADLLCGQNMSKSLPQAADPAAESKDRSLGIEGQKQWQKQELPGACLHAGGDPQDQAEQSFGRLSTTCLKVVKHPQQQIADGQRGQRGRLYEKQRPKIVFPTSHKATPSDQGVQRRFGGDIGGADDFASVMG